MFRDNKREIFSFRKYKNGRTDSKLIGATLLALGVGLVTTTQSVSADVVNGAGGSEVALVDSVDKTTSKNTNTFTDDTDTSKVAKFDAVLNKGVAEPTKANENKGDADGSDVLTVTSETTVNYKLEEDKSLLKTETVATGQGTITTPYDKKGLAADTDGKDYRESTVDKKGITVSEETGKEDTLELNGKVYERTRSEVEGADKAKYSKTQFNDIEASVSPEGMHNKLGEIDYTKTTGKVYLVEETSDGHYGKFVETDGVSSDEDAVSKWKAGLANAKDFTKANVTLQEGDSILVLDKDTYAVANPSLVKTKKRYSSPTYEVIPDVVDTDSSVNFDNPTYVLEQIDANQTANILEAGKDGIFGTSDDVERTVTGDKIADFSAGSGKAFIKEDLKPFFNLPDYNVLPVNTNPSIKDVLKNHESYYVLYEILKFAENEATSDSDKEKIRAAKSKVDAYLDSVATTLESKGLKVAYVKDSTLSNIRGKYYFVSDGSTEGDQFLANSEEASKLLSPNSSNIHSNFENLTFSNVKETKSISGDIETTVKVEKNYKILDTASLELETITTTKRTHLVTKENILSNYLEGQDTVTKEETSDLVKKGSVKVNDDGSVTVTTVETMPVYKFYKGVSFDHDNENSNEVQPDSDGFLRLSDDANGFSATAESSHNETTYNKREVITPIRAYKVVADGNSVVTHYYREKKAPLNVNYYLENTTTSLAPSENQADLPVKSDYTTQAKTIEPKTEVQDLPEKTVTTVTTYELVATPDNANGKIAEGGTTVNYYYRAVVNTTEVAKKAPVLVNYYIENTETKLAPSDDQGQKDIGSKYTSETKVIEPKVETEDLPDRVVTKTTRYELVSVPSDKEGTVPVEGKVVNYYYRPVVTTETVMKKAPVLVNYYIENTETKLAPSDDQGQKEIGSNYTSETKVIEPKVEKEELPDRTITKTTKYELVKVPEDKEGTVPVEGKVVNYYYRPVVTTETVMKKAPVLVNYYIENTETKLAPSDDQGQKEIGSNYTSETKVIEPKVEKEELPDRTITKTTKYELVKVPEDKEGTVPVEGKVVNYYYRPVVTTETVMKKAPVLVNYYIENTETKLAPSDDQGQKEIGSNYTSETKVIEPKVEQEELPDRTITKTTKYELVKVPEDKEGTVPVEGKVVNYYYRPVVTTETVMKKAPVLVNYYIENTETKLAPSDDQGQKEIGSNYTTEAKVIPSKVEKVVENGNVITRTTSYDLVKVPEDKDGIVPVGGKVVNYYYREVVEEVAKPNEAPKVEIPELKIPEESKPEPKPEPAPQPAPAPQPEPQPEPSPAPSPVPATPETPERPIAPATPEQLAEPATSQYLDGQRELPNTGTEDNASLAALGLFGVLSGFGLVARKKKED
ncbi:LPXTG cell wall anchor domain-containing protein [Streptococcus gwangjuensis]|uniref:LPXTG cell wall anchor domain-containing protein n=1 Tax=Streptococcus gwangjuensis TaxID=1433513 RepID=A0A387B3L1_9STRE|nr:LPXTG cell wall anchor domain-containing protein [Streptococcus gwangjuense]AYF95586.1 LPXTG cell wall anchor domain-containing protein [Streptococcus gwangjuense]